MKRLVLLILLGLFAALSVLAQDAEEEVVYDPEVCFAPAANNDGMVQYDAKEGPYTIGISNSFIGNAWRTQMLQMAHAFAETEEVAPLIEEARTHTTPSIERSVLLRMGFSSTEAQTLVERMNQRGLLGHGAGRLVLELAKAKGISVRAAGIALLAGDYWQELPR